MPLIALLGGLLSRVSVYLFGYMISKIVVALGFTWVVNKFAWQPIMETVKSYVAQGYNSLPADIAALLSIGGFTTGLGYLFGAWTFRLTLDGFNRVGRSLGFAEKS